MTLKRLFVNLLKENSKRRLWTIAMSITANFFAQIVYAILMFGRYSERLATDRTTLDDIRIHFYNNVGGMGNVMVIGITFILPVILALQGYYYLLDSKQTDLYYSLPIKREKLFDINNLCGILVFAIPYLVFNIITVIMGLARGYATFDTILLYPLNALVILLSFIMLYEICTLAVVLTGHIVVAVLGCGVFYLLGSFAYSIFSFLMATFFTSYWNEVSYYNIGYTGSPMGLAGEAIARLHGDVNSEIAFYTFDAAPAILKMLVIAILSFVVSRILVKRRPAEAAGKAMAFSITRPVIKVAIACVAGLGAGLVMYYIGDIHSVPMFIFGIICGVLVVHAVIETIYEFDFKACLSHYASLIVSAVISLIVFVVFFFDIFGYESWQPMPARVASVAIGDDVTYSGIMAPYSKTSDVVSADFYYGATANGMEYALYNMKLTDIDKAEKLTRLGAINAKEFHKDAFSGGQGIYGHTYREDDENTCYRQFQVQWNLKNGKTVRRIYELDINNEEVLSAFKDIYNTDEFRKGKFPVYDIARGEINSLEGQTLTGEVRKKLTDDEMDEFLKIYSEELSGQSFDDLATQIPNITLYGVMDAGKQAYYSQKYNFYIFDSFTRTNEFLKAHEIPTSWWNGDKEVNSIKVEIERWDDVNKQEIYSNWESSDSSEIDTVLKNIIPTDNYNVTGMNSDVYDEDDDATTVQITFNTSAGTYSDYLVILNKDELPDELKKKCFVGDDAALYRESKSGWVKCVNNG